MSDDKVKEKLREYLKSGQLNDLAKHIMADMSAEEARQLQEKFNKLVKAQKQDGALNNIDSKTSLSKEPNPSREAKD